MDYGREFLLPSSLGIPTSSTTIGSPVEVKKVCSPRLVLVDEGENLLTELLPLEF